jgi:hypothetical protein
MFAVRRRAPGKARRTFKRSAMYCRTSPLSIDFRSMRDLVGCEPHLPAKLHTAALRGFLALDIYTPFQKCAEIQGAKN